MSTLGSPKLNCNTIPKFSESLFRFDGWLLEKSRWTRFRIFFKFNKKDIHYERTIHAHSFDLFLETSLLGTYFSEQHSTGLFSWALHYIKKVFLCLFSFYIQLCFPKLLTALPTVSVAKCSTCTSIKLSFTYLNILCLLLN